MVLGENWLQASVIVDAGIALINGILIFNQILILYQVQLFIHINQLTIIIVSGQFISDIVKSSN